MYNAMLPYLLEYFSKMIVFISEESSILFSLNTNTGSSAICLPRPVGSTIRSGCAGISIITET